MPITHSSKDITDTIEMLQRHRSFAGSREALSRFDLAIDYLDDCLFEAEAREEAQAAREAADADALLAQIVGLRDEGLGVLEKAKEA